MISEEALDKIAKIIVYGVIGVICSVVFVVFLFALLKVCIEDPLMFLIFIAIGIFGWAFNRVLR